MPLGTHRASRSVRAVLTRQTRWALGTRWTCRSLNTVRTCWTDWTLNASRASRSSRAVLSSGASRSLNTSRSVLTSRALRTYNALGTCCSLRPRIPPWGLPPPLYLEAPWLLGNPSPPGVLLTPLFQYLL